MMRLLPFHVVGGAMAIVSGLLALYVVKGSRVHRRSGTAFVWAILLMALTGAAIAVGRLGAEINIPAALVTAYLVTTAVLTVRAPSVRSRPPIEQLVLERRPLHFAETCDARQRRAVRRGWKRTPSVSVRTIRLDARTKGTHSFDAA